MTNYLTTSNLSNLVKILFEILKGDSNLKTAAALLVGPPGCGKTQLIREAFSGLEFKREGNHLIAILNNVKYKLYEMHGNTPTTDLYIPCVTNGILTHSIHKNLQYLLKKSEKECDVGILVIQDVNKNPSRTYTSFLKELLDGTIAGQEMIPTILIFTCNPFDPTTYNNQMIDTTISSACYCYCVNVSVEKSVIDIIARNNTTLAKYITNNSTKLFGLEDDKNILGFSPISSARSFSMLARFLDAIHKVGMSSEQQLEMVEFTCKYLFPKDIAMDLIISIKTTFNLEFTFDIEKLAENPSKYAMEIYGCNNLSSINWENIVNILIAKLKEDKKYLEPFVKFLTKLGKETEETKGAIFTMLLTFLTNKIGEIEEIYVGSLSPSLAKLKMFINNYKTKLLASANK